jgi:hypothetical protein
MVSGLKWMEEKLSHLVVPRAWNASKLLHASSHLDVLVRAVEILQACRNMRRNWNDQRQLGFHTLGFYLTSF